MREIPGAAALALCYRICRQDDDYEDGKWEFSNELRQILEVIAQTGSYWHEWPMLQALLSFRLKQVLMEYPANETLETGEASDVVVKRLDEGLKSFTEGPPFTLQRLCEVLLNPKSTYPSVEKLVLALEKLLLVTSTIPPSTQPYPSFPGNGEQREDGKSFSPQGGAEANGLADPTHIGEDIPAKSENAPEEEPRIIVQTESLSPPTPSNESGKSSLPNKAPSVEDDLVIVSLQDEREAEEH